MPSAVDLFSVSHCSSAGAHDAVDLALHLGVVELVLGLPLKLRLAT